MSTKGRPEGEFRSAQREGSDLRDERDLHDPTLDAAWRAHVQEAPPRALDDAILAAAHRAVQSAPRTAGGTPPRWKAWAPLAVAATLGAIALGVLQLAPRDEDATRSVVSDAPVASMPKPARPSERQAPAPAPPVAAPAPAEPAPAAKTAERAAGTASTAPASPAASKAEVAQRRLQAPAPTGNGRLAETPTDQLAKQLDAAERKETARAQEREGRVAQDQAFLSRKDAPASAPQPFPASPSTSTSPSPPPASSSAAASAVGGAAAPAPAASAPAIPALAAQNAQRPAAAHERDSGADMRAKVATARPADDYIREIHRLRAEGRDADAALALAAFRAAYPDADARLPDDLRAWARGVPRP